MNYISLDNLTRYHRNFRNYGDATYALTRGSLWKQTEKAGAVTCWPVGESRMKPVVEFKFKETLPVSDKSEQNPSTITGISSIKVTRCGKNLLPRNPISSVMSQRGITVTYNEDGSIHLKGTATSGYDAYMTYFNNASLGVVPVVMAAGKIFTVSITCSDSNVSGKIYDSDSLTVWGSPVNVSPGTPVTHTMQSDVASAMFRIMVTRGSTVDCDVYCQIEYGQTATEWEAPADEDYTIPLGNTYYGGTLDVTTGKLTVTHRMIESDSLTIDISNYPAYLPLDCTDTFGRTITSTGNILALTGSTGGKIVYKLANPYTVQIDPVTITALPQVDKYTPRINTLYTDAENITVGYQKSPIRDEYEKVQAIIANGGTI